MNKLAPLPPLNTLKVFESAARLLSFTATAKELNLTQSAVSRQIKQLEVFLGKALFHRGRRGVRLTPSGQRYFAIIQPTLKTIALETAELMTLSGDNHINVVCSHDIAHFWLMPRLSKWRQQHPEIHVRIITEDNCHRVATTEFDIGLYYFAEPPPQVNATRIFSERVIVVCSAAYKKQHADLPLSRPEDLAEHTLLILEESFQEWITWQTWFARIGVSYHPPKQTVKANDYSLLFNAAVAGHGICLAWERLIQDYVDKGILEKAILTDAPARDSFFLIEPQWKHSSAATRLFKQWLLAICET